MASDAPGPTPEPPVRRRILDEATRLFARKGFEGTSVAEIVAAAGVTKGAMYHYFSAKDDLLVDVYDRLLQLQARRLEQFVAAEGPVDERLRAAAVDVVLTSAEHYDAFVVFARSMHLLGPEQQRRVRAHRRSYHDRFRGLVRAGQEEGVFRASLDVDVAVHAFFSAAHGIPDWFRPTGPLTLAQVAAQLGDLLLDGVRARG